MEADGSGGSAWNRVSFWIQRGVMASHVQEKGSKEAAGGNVGGFQE